MPSILRRLSNRLERVSHSRNASKKSNELSLTSKTNGTHSNILSGDIMSTSPTQTTQENATPFNGHQTTSTASAAASAASSGPQDDVAALTSKKIDDDRRERAVRPNATILDSVVAEARVGEAQRQATATPTSADSPAVLQSAYAQGYVSADQIDDQVRNSVPRLKKRLVLFCDGTWQDGTKTDAASVTNVLRLARCVLPEDASTYPPTPQIVYYQSGVGTTDVPLANMAQGATGAGIVAKIREAYTFVAQNFLPGDEIFLFGFSRGAYTARTIAALIGDVGVLPRTEMQNFNTIFKAYQALGSDDANDRAKANVILNPLRANLMEYQDGDEGKWSIRCVGVFDTVGALGIPVLSAVVDSDIRLLGFNDTHLGHHIAYAFHALAIDEPREDFTPTKWYLTKEGKRKNQLLEQVWFSGSHSDVGGGYESHDLADLTLAWMMSNLLKHQLIALDVGYFYTIPRPHAAWGALKPHDPRASGFMALAWKTIRPLPVAWNEETREYYHTSTADRACVKDHLKAHPELLAEFMPLEAEIRDWWSKQPISHSYDEVGQGGLFSSLRVLAHDVVDGDSEDEDAGGHLTKAESRKKALEAARGAWDTEGAPPPMKVPNPNARADSIHHQPPSSSDTGGPMTKAKYLLHDLVEKAL